MPAKRLPVTSPDSHDCPKSERPTRLGRLLSRFPIGVGSYLARYCPYPAFRPNLDNSWLDRRKRLSMRQLDSFRSFAELIRTGEV